MGLAALPKSKKNLTAQKKFKGFYKNNGKLRKITKGMSKVAAYWYDQAANYPQKVPEHAYDFLWDYHLASSREHAISEGENIGIIIKKDGPWKKNFTPPTERTAVPPEPTIFGRKGSHDIVGEVAGKPIAMDLVNHPSHYNSGKIEVIEAIEDWGLDYHLGNTVKYIARAGKKDPAKKIEDLEKGAWYLNRKILTLKAARDGTPVAKPNDTKVQR